MGLAWAVGGGGAQGGPRGPGGGTPPPALHVTSAVGTCFYLFLKSLFNNARTVADLPPCRAGKHCKWGHSLFSSSPAWAAVSPPELPPRSHLPVGSHRREADASGSAFHSAPSDPQTLRPPGEKHSAAAAPRARPPAATSCRPPPRLCPPGTLPVRSRRPGRSAELPVPGPPVWRVSHAPVLLRAEQYSITRCASSICPGRGGLSPPSGRWEQVLLQTFGPQLWMNTCSRCLGSTWLWKQRVTC